ncbi:MAG: phage tail tip lysozyme [Bradyrhizobium sp.]|uniref:phage tail tip lysozyme n=1 Tax=Bradyrhizobium sp. TaxID=376 RepID=UPI003D107A83
MTTQLSSLRVTADMDVTAYARGMAEKVRVDRAGAASSAAVGAALAQQDAALEKSVPGLAKLSRQFIDGYGSASTFERAVRAVGAAVDRGMGLDRATVLLDGIYRKFGLTADANALLRQGFTSIAPVVSALNDQYAGLARETDAAAVSVRNLASAQGASQRMVGGMSQFGRASLETSQASERMVRGMSSASREATTLGRNAGLARYELINLSRQFQDIAVSLQGGQSLPSVLLQQGSQIADIFASSEGSVTGFVRQAVSGLGRVLTPTRLLTVGVAGIGIAAVAAWNSWDTAQKEVERGLSGVGRGSGLLIDDINRISRATSEWSGLSISQARQVATAYAATGKVGGEMAERLTGLTHDVAATLGVEVGEAAQILAKSFADPVRGAEQLNERLGFMDARQQRLIQNLMEQNRLYEAQQVLVDGISGSTREASEVTGFWSQAWNAISNTTSNLFDRFGQDLSAVTGLGQSPTQELEGLRARLDALTRDRTIRAGRGMDLSLITPEIERLKTRISEIEGKLAAGQRKTEEQRLRAQSLRVAPLVARMVPEVRERESLANLQGVLGAAAEDPVQLQRLGFSQQQVDLAAARMRELAQTYRSTIKQMTDDGDLALRAARARTPDERGQLAYDEAMSRLSNTPASRGEKEAIADLSRMVVLTQIARQLEDTERNRLRTMEERQSGLALEIALTGRSAGDVATLQANWQAVADLRREMEVNGGVFDREQYKRIADQNALLGQQVQLLEDIRTARQLMGARAEYGQTSSQYGRLLGSGMIDRDAYTRAMDRLNLGVLDERTDMFAGLERGLIRIRMKAEDTASTIEDALTSAFDRIGDSWVETGKFSLDGVGEIAMKAARRLAWQGVTSGFMNLTGLGQAKPLDQSLLGTALGGGLGSLGTMANPMYVRMADFGLGTGLLAGLFPGNVGGAAGAAGAAGLFSPAGAAGLLSGGAGAFSGLDGTRGQIWNFFAGKGLAPHQISGILGNLSAESSFNPMAVNPTSGAFGLAQWLDRKPALFNMFGRNPTTDQQLQFMWHELTGTEGRAFKQLLGSTDVRGATAAFAGFERAEGFSWANPEGIAGWSERLQAAQQAMLDSTQRMATTFTGQLGGNLDNIVQGTGQIGQGFTQGFGNQLSGILNGIGGQGGQGGGGLFGWLGSLFGGGLGAGAWGGGSAWGNMLVGYHHTGSIIGSTPVPTGLMPAHIFANAPRLHLGSNEVPIIAERGERMFSVRDNRDLINTIDRAAFGRPQVNVSVDVKSTVAGVNHQVDEEDDGRGGRKISIVAQEMTVAGIRGPKGRKAMRGFGVSQRFAAS